MCIDRDICELQHDSVYVTAAWACHVFECVCVYTCVHLCVAAGATVCAVTDRQRTWQRQKCVWMSLCGDCVDVWQWCSSSLDLDSASWTPAALASLINRTDEDRLPSCGEGKRELVCMRTENTLRENVADMMQTFKASCPHKIIAHNMLSSHNQKVRKCLISTKANLLYFEEKRPSLWAYV